MAIPFSNAIAEAILERAQLAEIGIALCFNDDTDLSQIRNKLYSIGVADNLQISFMDNPKELWILKKELDLQEALNGK